MTAGYDAIPEELQFCAAMLAQVDTEVRAALDILQSEVDGLFSGGWQGPAAAAFADAWLEWREGADEVVDGLHDISLVLRATEREYTTNEQGATDRITGSGSGL
ncbi:WXG100 family type VII secretion target [Actinokineospora inagensis]|uniref:WXG100 family type VII secretion target n=1 Tax=Actinokineospora inagensis TaxID=103730 RepID=UPI0003F8A59B|nr:WXG100 family type VII secretion target [Actinokineospora inagensis]